MSGNVRENETDDQPEVLLNVVEGAKRQQVSAACERCRQGKAKCDGQRPCRRCARRNLPCKYTGLESETTGQTLKRKYNELSELYETLQTGDESKALQIFQQIRAGEPVDAIIKRTHPQASERNGLAAYRSRRFLYALVQTNAPLADLVRLASGVLSNPQLASKLPEPAAWEPLRDCVVTMETLTGVLAQSNPNVLQIAPGKSISPIRIADGFAGSPPFWVSAMPWTTVTISDYVVSHLVSTFLALVNGFWRILEQDVFLKALRSGKPSDYCSPFLVNAVLACASLFTEIEEAFTTAGQTLTRGLHFHQEALRLWSMEMDRVSITNVQALIVLSMDSSIRGRDKLGLELKDKAVTLHQALISDFRAPERAQDRADDMRLRKSLAWTVVWMDFCYAFGLLSSYESIRSSLSDAPDDLDLVLPDTVVYWLSYPLRQEPLPVRMNLLFQQRCTLNAHMATFMQNFFSNYLPDRRILLARVKSLDQDLQAWRMNLPGDLCYKDLMPVPLFELHGQYFSVQLMLHNRAVELLQVSEDGQDNLGLPADIRISLTDSRRESLRYAHQTAQYLKDFRQMYGYKITPTAIMHPAAIAASVLLQNMKDTEARINHDSDNLDGQLPLENLERIHVSFEECFQCLLGMGMQNLLPRAIARSVYHGATQMKVRLPDNVVQMLRVVADTAWQPSDLRQLNSSYPNWVTLNDLGNKSIEQMPYWLEKWERIAKEDTALISQET